MCSARQIICPRLEKVVEEMVKEIRNPGAGRGGQYMNINHTNPPGDDPFQRPTGNTWARIAQ
jgi:hypothetical protein